MEDLVGASLLLLGVCSEDQWDADMFRRGKPGAPKLLLELVHGLLCRIDREAATHEFRGVWPVLDKVQEKDARKVALAWLARLEQQGRLPPDCSRLSDLTGAKGERVYVMLAAICKAALQSQLVRMVKPVPRLPEPDVSSFSVSLAARMVRAATLRISAQRARFLSCVSRAAALLVSQRRLAGELSDMAALRGQPADVAAARASEREQRREQPPEAAERVRGVWGMLGRLAAAPEPQQGSAGERAVTGDPAQAAREYGQLVVRAVAKMGRVDWSVVRGHSGECTARMTALMRLQQRVETRLDRLEQQQQQQQPQYQTTNNKHYQQQQEQEQPPLERNHQQSQGSAARLAAAAARVAPAFDRSLAEKGKTFSPRKKLVL